jgi:hypothetical protein
MELLIVVIITWIIRLVTLSLPFIPLLAYLIVFVASTKYLKGIDLDRKYQVLNDRMRSNLTMVGFSIAVISILARPSLTIVDVSALPIYYFSVAVVFFLSSYILLHLRIRNFFDFLSDSLTTSGLWSITCGFFLLFLITPGLKLVSLVFLFLILILTIYLLVDCVLKIQTYNKGEK